MENKNVLISTVAALVLLISTGAQAQNRFGFIYDCNFGASILKIKGTALAGETTYGTVGSHVVPGNPIYKNMDTTGILAYIDMNVGLHVLLIDKDDWYTSLRLNAGLHFTKDIQAAEGLEGVMVSLPQDVVFVRRFNAFNWVNTVGYSYTFGPLPYHSLRLSTGINLEESRVTVSLFASPLNTKYYNYYTDGTYEVALRQMSFGILIMRAF